jgi:hypothetical protein
MANVSVNRGLLIGVGTVAAVSLLALAFVLGRESGSGSVPAPATKIERIAPRLREEPLPPPASAAAASSERAEERPISRPAPAAPAQGFAAQLAPVQAPAPVDSGRGAGSDPDRASVVAYFDAIEHIQPGAMHGEAEGIATEMAASLANGDTSGLDKMVRQTEAAKASLAAIAPPAACAAFHRESLESLDDGLEVLRALKTAMESPEPAAQLAGVTARANALRSRADVLQKEEQDLRQRYGLKR